MTDLIHKKAAEDAEKNILAYMEKEGLTRDQSTEALLMQAYVDLEFLKADIANSVSLDDADVLIKDRDDIILVETSDVISGDIRGWIEKQFDLILRVIHRLEDIPA